MINYYTKHKSLWELVMLSELVLLQVDQPHPYPTLFMGLVKVRYRQYFCTRNSIKHLRESTLFFSKKTLKSMMLSKCSTASYFNSHSGKSITFQLFDYWLTFHLDDIKIFQTSKYPRTHVLMTWIKICHILKKL